MARSGHLGYLVAVSFWTQAKKEPVDLTTLKAHCDFYFLGTLSITNYLVDTYQFQRKFKGLIIYSPTMSNGYYLYWKKMNFLSDIISAELWWNFACVWFKTKNYSTARSFLCFQSLQFNSLGPFWLKLDMRYSNKPRVMKYWASSLATFYLINLIPHGGWAQAVYRSQ